MPLLIPLSVTWKKGRVCYITFILFGVTCHTCHMCHDACQSRLASYSHLSMKLGWGLGSKSTLQAFSDSVDVRLKVKIHDFVLSFSMTTNPSLRLIETVLLSLFSLKKCTTSTSTTGPTTFWFCPTCTQPVLPANSTWHITPSIYKSVTWFSWSGWVRMRAIPEN